jgi:uncharacterized protein YjgD (DUF1641 family)
MLINNEDAMYNQLAEASSETLIEFLLGLIFSVASENEYDA